MAFQEVQDLNCETTISLGGVQKKTNKPNPRSVEGYYLGRREVEDKKKKSGISYIYVLQTSKGNLGVWGKTDMDRKMSAVPAGAMIRITHTGFQATNNGEMYKYKVEIDRDNTIDVSLLETASGDESAADEPADHITAATSIYDEVDDAEDLYEDEAPADVVVAARPAKPATRPLSTPSAAAQAKVKELLQNRASKTS